MSLITIAIEGVIILEPKIWRLDPTYAADRLDKVTDHMHRSAEACVLWLDPAPGSEWPRVGVAPQLAPKDAAAPPLSRAKAFDLAGA